MKRILFLSFYFRPDLCAGSFRNSPLLDELYRQTSGTDIRIDVYTTSPNRYSTFREDYETLETKGHLKIERIPVPAHQSGIRDQMVSFFKYFTETIKRTRGTRYDLVYASSSRFFTSYLAYRIALRNHTPLYLDVRDIFSETVRGISDNPLIKHLLPPFLAFAEKKVYRYARHINLISPGFRNSFNTGFADKFSFYTHGVDPLFVRDDSENITPEPRRVKTIVYAGNIGEGQGLHKIIPEVAKMTEQTHRFVMIGDGGALSELTSSLRERNVKNVSLKNPVQREQLVDVYRQADILFLHLNEYDIFQKVLPSKIFELAVSGKPVLAGVTGYARDFLEQHVPGSYIFSPCHAEGMVRQLKKIDETQPWISQKHIDGFAEKFDRKTINREMARSILDCLKA